MPRHAYGKEMCCMSTIDSDTATMLNCLDAYNHVCTDVLSRWISRRICACGPFVSHVETMFLCQIEARAKKKSRQKNVRGDDTCASRLESARVQNMHTGKQRVVYTDHCLDMFRHGGQA